METINSIDIYKGNFADRTVKENGKTYYICNTCGRKNFRAIRSFGKIWCYKHYKQMKKYGKVLDDNPRTLYDRNEIHINGKVSLIDLYDKNGIVIAQTKIDTEDIPKIRYTKWKLSHGYAVNNQKRSGITTYIHREVLQTNQFVDHINHDTLDNRKCNLRIVTKSQNQMNSNYKGVYKQPNSKYMAYIKLHQKMLNLGVYIDKEEAMYARWYAEKIVFKEYRFPKEKPKILETRKKEIQEYVNKKVQRL